LDFFCDDGSATRRRARCFEVVKRFGSSLIYRKRTKNMLEHLKM
jgi:hypothetical protein